MTQSLNTRQKPPKEPRHSHMKGRHGSTGVALRHDERADTKARPKKRTAHELDLLDLLKHSREHDRRLLDALVVIATHGNARVLAAIGTVVDFAVTTARAAR